MVAKDDDVLFGKEVLLSVLGECVHVMSAGLALNEKGDLIGTHILQLDWANPLAFQRIWVGAQCVLVREQMAEAQRVQFEGCVNLLFRGLEYPISYEQIYRKLNGFWGIEAVKLIAVMNYLGLWAINDVDPGNVVVEKIDRPKQDPPAD